MTLPHGSPTPTVAARQIQVGRSVVSYREAGDGTPLVLLHGIGSAARAFDDQLAVLSSRLRVVAWDAPGYGGSTCLAPESPLASDYAEALLGFLDALGVPACHLVGHSLGALMAASFAARHPDRILSLTLASVAAGHARMQAAERQKLLAQRLDDIAELGPRRMAEQRGPRLLGPGATPGMMRRVVETMASVRPDGYGQAARMLAAGDIKADIARLPADMPVQFIYGDGDVITPPNRNIEIAALRPAAPVHVIGGAGHAVYLERPELFNAALVDFTARIEGTRS
jgi:pimeloyl-ACP methyl ester carboxylesterase